MLNIRDDSAETDGSWSPFGTTGRISKPRTERKHPVGPLAMPGMIHEPINALMRLAENSRFPDGRLGIPNPGNAQNRDDVLTGLLSMYGGNAMNPGG